MRWSVASLLAGTVFVLGAGMALAADDTAAKPVARPTTPSASPAGPDVPLRFRTLGIVPDVFTPPSIEIEAQRAPTGAGTMRWPSARTEIAPGVWVTVMPACRPEDELWRLPRRRTPRP